MNESSPIFTETFQVLNLNNSSDSDNFEIEVVYNSIPNLELPFENYHEQNKKIYYLLTPFFNHYHINTYTNLTNSLFNKIGFSIYQEFPSTIKNKYEPSFHKNNPNDYNLIDDSKNYFFNYSNFLFQEPKNIINTKNIDIVIVCDNFFNNNSKEWLKYYHNVSLINKSLKILSKTKFNIYVFDPSSIVKRYSNINYVSDISNLNLMFEKSKICIIFNKHASFIPYIGNALSRNNVILMYHSILGEWNLINKYTGMFFSNQNTLIDNINLSINNYSSFKPAKWYLKKHNPKSKIKLLFSTISKLYKNIQT